MAIDGARGLTAERLQQVVKYDPETGLFEWLTSLSARRPIGSECGEIKHSGYRLIGIDGMRYRAHRLAWLYMTGEWPDGQVDHRNGIRSDNRWVNLRQATQQQNSANMMRPRPPSGTPKGVHRYYNAETGTVRFRAHIMVGGRTLYLGSFRTQSEAAEAYRSAAKTHFGQYARVA